MITEHFPHFTFIGDAQNRGLAYGETLRDRIHTTFEVYHERLFAKSRLTESDFIARAEHVRSIIMNFNRELTQELDAIAEASEMPGWQIYLLNARTEILNAKIDECTTVCFPQSALLGQTWDWFEGFEELTILVTYERPDGSKILTFSEPGMLAKIGLNSAGVGVCLNYLNHRHTLDGLPVHILARAILECPSVADARRSIKRAGFGKSSHFLIADVANDALSIEFMGASAETVEPYNTAYLHTNHCIFPDAPAQVTEENSSTARRLARARALLANTDERTFATLKQILVDTHGADFAINNPFHPSATFPGERIGSCGTFIMDLTRREMHVRKGPGETHPFATYAID